MQKANHDIRILVVDDDHISLAILFKFLEVQKFRVFVAENGGKALQQAEKIHPDIVLLDVMLPDMIGFEVCRRLKASRTTRRSTVIFMTAMTETVDKLKGFQAGGADYITKPFDCDELMARIKPQLDIRSLQTQLRQERDRFRRLSEAASEGIIIYENGRIKEANRAAALMTGYSVAELTGKTLFDLFTPDYHELMRENIEKKEVGPYIVRGRKKRGESSVLKIRQKEMNHAGREYGIMMVADISHETELEQENRKLRQSLARVGRFGEMVGVSAAMQKVYEDITRAASSEESVIINGETGTGKELAARMIFDKANNHTRAFVTVNCASVPETLFESQFFGHRKGAFTGANANMAGFFDQANGGTLFLDEIGELKPGMQAKLLRVLQNGEYLPVGSSKVSKTDVRVIAATNKNIHEMVEQGRMRADFYYRLSVINITLPPLRQRREDIPLLAEHFLSTQTEKGSPSPELSGAILRRLHSYHWPGNVRELFNVLRRYRVHGVLEPSNYPTASTETGQIPFISETMTLDRAVRAFETYYIHRILNHCSGKKKDAAEVLGVHRRTLYNKLKRADVSGNQPSGSHLQAR